ncbi:MAG: MMPL family transporter [Gammaproteobacteria bacterium]
MDKFAEFCVNRRWLVVAVLFGLSAVMAGFSTQVEFKTEFQDLLPVDHPYISTNDKYKETFGGSNIVSIMLTVEEGDIFRREILEKIQSITVAMDYVPAVNQYQIISLASRKLKDIKASTYGIETEPMMFPDLPANEREIEELRQAVLSNPLVYGRYVSMDQKSALITVDFIDRLIDYEKIYSNLMQVAADHESEGVTVRVVGEPILTGWVIHFLPETLKIFGLTISAMALVLFVTVRTLRGVFLPLFSGAISGAWALGMAAIFGINFDPLIIVIAFLVSARVISHAVQLSTAFDDEIARGLNAIEASKASMKALFRPGMLGVATDTAAVMVVYVMPMPLLQKTSIIGSIWVSTIAFSAIILTPVLLSWVRRPERVDFPVNTGLFIERFLNRCADIVIGRGSAVILGLAALLFVVAGYFAFNVTVGDANPGSPLLWPDSRYNQDAAAINTAFQGSDRMFVVVEGKEPDVLKQPSVLQNMENFQRSLENQPEIGGSVSLVDLIGPVNVSLHEGNKRFDEFGTDASLNGELIYMYLQGADPGDIDRFSDVHYQVGAVTAYFRDHKGETIRTAISRIKEYIADNPLENAEYKLAGGLIGVLAAVNEEIFRGQIESISLALLVLFVLAALAYRSTVAGMFFMPLVLMSNAVTFAYMSWQNIGMNINTLPVAALGIGLGVDYAFYIVDGIRERYIENRNIDAAIRGSLLTAGRGVLVTGATMILSVLLWYTSSLRFQADMGLLIALWLSVSAISSLLLIPSMVYIFKPDFVFDVEEHEVEGLQPEAAV